MHTENSERRVDYGEVIRLLQRIDAETSRRLQAIEAKLDDGVFVRSEILTEKEKTAEEWRKALSARVAELEGWQTWATRSIIGAFIGIFVEVLLAVWMLVSRGGGG